MLSDKLTKEMHMTHEFMFLFFDREVSMAGDVHDESTHWATTATWCRWRVALKKDDQLHTHPSPRPGGRSSDTPTKRQWKQMCVYSSELLAPELVTRVSPAFKTALNRNKKTVQTGVITMPHNWQRPTCLQRRSWRRSRSLKLNQRIED